jgi:hypothetical protein
MRLVMMRFLKSKKQRWKKSHGHREGKFPTFHFLSYWIRHQQMVNSYFLIAFFKKELAHNLDQCWCGMIDLQVQEKGRWKTCPRLLWNRPQGYFGEYSNLLSLRSWDLCFHFIVLVFGWFRV